MCLVQENVTCENTFKSIGGNFSRVQFTPDVLPSDVTGIEYFNPKTSEFELRLDQSWQTFYWQMKLTVQCQEHSLVY